MKPTDRIIDDDVHQDIEQKIAEFFSCYGVEEIDSLTVSADDDNDTEPAAEVSLAPGRSAKDWKSKFRDAVKWPLVKLLTRLPRLHGLYLRAIGWQDPASSASVSLSKSEVRALFDRALADFLAGDQKLMFAQASSPKVSVIVVVYNQPGLLLQTLKFLQPSLTDSELIVVDNASDASTTVLLSRLQGTKLIQNQDNAGFLQAANQGAAEASGDYLLFLNSDCIVFPDAIEHALRFMQNHPEAGAIGARIINFNGLLQEAGSEVLPDGSCRGIGRGMSPFDYRYMWTRTVDFCSGAFLLTPRRLFEQHGGFDEAYAPAYYEEVDYCLRLLSNDHKTYYLPKSTVLHYEFGSEEKRGDAIAQQVRNRRTFQRKHKTFLNQKKRLATVDRTERIVQQGLSVLFIDDHVPHPALGAGSPRAKAIIEALAQTDSRVTFYSIASLDERWQSIYATVPDTVQVVRPAGLPNLAEFLRQHDNEFEMIIVSRPHNMRKVLPELSKLKNFDKRSNRKSVQQAPFVVYDAEAIFSDREVLRAGVLNDPYLKRRAKQARKQEFKLFEACDLVWAVSPRDAETIRAGSQVSTQHVGHALTTQPSTAGFADRQHFLFVGLLRVDGSPNVDSLLWFAHEVWPQIRAKLGHDVKLLVAGDCSASSLQQIKDDSIQFLDVIETLDSYYDSCRVFVAPTRFAAGVPHKVHEAAAHGLPVVASELLCQQLEWRDGEEIRCANSSEIFTERCIELYRSEALWTKIRSGALAAVERDCSAEQFRESIRESIALAKVQKVNTFKSQSSEAAKKEMKERQDT